MKYLNRCGIECMGSQQRGFLIENYTVLLASAPSLPQFLFRPSNKGPAQIACTWRIEDKARHAA